MQTVTLNVDDEIKAIGDAMKMLIADISAKKATAQIVSDVLPGLLSAISAYGAMGVDIKKVDNQAYLAKCLGEALEPVTPAAV